MTKALLRPIFAALLLVWGAVGFLSRANAQMDPGTAFSLFSAATSMLSGPAAHSDGGMAAYMQANTEYLKTTLQSLDHVISGLADIKAKLDLLPAQLKTATDVGRQLGRYEDIRSSLQKFIELNEEDQNLPESKRNLNEGAYRDVAERVQAARGALMLYPSIVSAAAMPEALGLEVAARLKGNQPTKVQPILKSYDEWALSIENASIPDSVAWVLRTQLFPSHRSQLDACRKLFSGASDCEPLENQTVNAELSMCFTPFIGEPGGSFEERMNIRIAYVVTARGDVNKQGVIEVHPSEMKRVNSSVRDANCKLVRLMPAPTCASNCPVLRPDNTGLWATVNPPFIDISVAAEEQTFSGQWSSDRYADFLHLSADIDNTRNEIDVFNRALVLTERARAEISARQAMYK